jgi:hypothetical protein
MNPTKKEKLALGAAGGSVALAAAAGACVTGCSVGGTFFSLFLGSIGLSAVASSLPTLRVPLVVVAVLLAIIGIRGLYRQGRRKAVALVSVASLVAVSAVTWQILNPPAALARGAMAQGILKMTPPTREVVQKGIYGLWPKLGRAPTSEEIQRELALPSAALVLAAFRELEELDYGDMFYPGTQKIRWLWPFSSENHGVDVVLGDGKPVHARCAIDALGMSAMFGVPAKISVTTPVDKKVLQILVSGDRFTNADQSILVSHRPNDCDSMLFFSSRDEFDRYLKVSGKDQMRAYPLQQALERGILSFGTALKS